MKYHYNDIKNNIIITAPNSSATLIHEYNTDKYMITIK